MTYNLTEFKEWLNQQSHLSTQVTITYDLPRFLEEKVTDFSQLLDQNWLVTEITNCYPERNRVHFRPLAQDSAEKVSRIVNIFIQEKEVDQLKEQKLNMINKKQRFTDWLEADPNRKANLPNWAEFLEILSESEIDFYFLEAVNYIWKTEDTSEQVKKYFEIYGDWVLEETGKTLTSSLQSPLALLEKKEEFKKIVSEKADLDAKLKTYDEVISNYQEKLKKSWEDHNKLEEESKQLQIKKIDDLQEQLNNWIKTFPRKTPEQIKFELKRNFELTKDIKDLSGPELAELIEFIKEAIATKKINKSYADLVESLTVLKENKIKVSLLEQNLKVKENELITLQNQHQKKLAGKETALTQLQNKLKTLRESIKSKEQELTHLRDQTAQSTATLRKEIHCLKDQINSLKNECQTTEEQKKQLNSQLTDKDTKIINLENQIQQLKEQVITAQSEQERVHSQLTQKDKQITDLEDKLTNLTIASGLLSKQCEDLTTELTSTQQESQHRQFELQRKESELKEKNNTLSEQEQQIKNYQSLLRNFEEQQTKCQRILTEKSNQLEQIDQARNNLADLLDQAEEKISNLEDSLLISHTRTSELESQIKNLEQKGDNSNELTRLKQELSTLKSNSQSEINSLKNLLQQAQIKENKLQQKIQALNSKTTTESLEQAIENSWWDKIKSPFFAIVGILIIIFTIRWLFSKSKF